MSKRVTELPAGKYDAVRVLRQTLQLAEEGEIDDVIVICQKQHIDSGNDLWVVWSELARRDVFWLCRWFNSWLDKRYFGDYHSDEDEDKDD